MSPPLLCSSKMVSVALGPSASLRKESLVNANVSCAVRSIITTEEALNSSSIHVKSTILEAHDSDHCTNLSLAALELVGPPIVQVLHAAWSQ